MEETLELNVELKKEDLKDNRFYEICFQDYHWTHKNYISLYLDNVFTCPFYTTLSPDKLMPELEKETLYEGYKLEKEALCGDNVQIFNVTDWVNDFFHELLNLSGFNVIENNNGKKEVVRYIFNRDYDIYPGDKIYGITMIQITRFDNSIMDVVSRPHSIHMELDILSDHNFVTNSYFGLGKEEYIIIIPYNDESTFLYDKWREAYLNWYGGNLKKEKLRFRNYNLFNINNNE